MAAIVLSAGGISGCGDFKVVRQFPRSKLIYVVLNTVAQFERDLLIERTQSSLQRAKSEGKVLGRPSTLSEKQKEDVRDDLATGMSVSAIAKKMRQADRPSCVSATKIHAPFDLSVSAGTVLVPTPHWGGYEPRNRTTLKTPASEETVSALASCTRLSRWGKGPTVRTSREL